MLIASKFKRPNVAIDLDGVNYYFKPVDPANPESEHVAEVSNPDHVQRFLGIVEGYHLPRTVPFEKKPTPAAAAPVVPPAPPAPAPVPAAPAAPVAEVTAPETPAAPGGDSGGAESPADTGQAADTDSKADEAAGPSEETLSAAKALQALTFQKLQVELKKGGIPDDVLNAAIAIETSRPKDEIRETVVKALAKSLKVG